MIFKTYSDIVKGRVETAPMVDVVFLLLIFFILSSSFVLQSGYEVRLPSGNLSDTIAQGLVVTVTRENLLFFQNERTTLEALQKSLQAAAQTVRNQALIIKADRQVTHGTVVKIMSMAIEAGIHSVNIATRPEMPVAPGKNEVGAR